MVTRSRPVPSRDDLCTIDLDGGIMTDEMITITKAEYKRLKDRSFWLDCLEDAGVDYNWEFMGEAIDIRRKALSEDEDDL